MKTKKPPAKERNKNVENYVNQKISEVKKLKEKDFSDFNTNSEMYKMLSDLIVTNNKGYRGIVITAIVGLHLDQKYDPLNNFYGCNPRAIFENGIYLALVSNKIPCGKSDPLNVAKGVSKLDESWRSTKEARAVINFIKKILNEKNTKDKENLINYFFFRLVNYAESINKIEINTKILNGDITKRLLGEKISTFIVSHPERGSTPQFVVGKILENIYLHSKVEVMGMGESVFGTNTTSKKPADIWTRLEEKIINLYEITVKKIDLKRIEDCFSVLSQMNEINSSITFICQLTENTKDINLINGTYCYKNKIFDFIGSTELVLQKTKIKWQD